MEKNQENSADFLLEDDGHHHDPWILFDESKILLGDVHWTSPRGKKILLHKCTSLLSSEKRSRILNNRAQFSFEVRVDEAYYRQTKTLLGNLASRTREINQRLENQKESRDNILKHALPAFWFGQEERNLFDIVLAWNEQMNQLPSEIETQLLESNEVFYKRAMVLGWAMNIYALMLGHCDYYFLKDLYNICFYIDLPLVNKGLSTLDLSKLENNALLLDHGKHALEARKICEKYLDLFKFKSVMRLVERHHETTDGNGPLKISSIGLTELESLFIHVNNRISYEKEPFESMEGKSLLMKMLEPKESSQLKLRAAASLESALKAFESEDTDYLSVGGL